MSADAVRGGDEILLAFARAVRAAGSGAAYRT